LVFKLKVLSIVAKIIKGGDNQPILHLEVLPSVEYAMILSAF
jgi:hypothetical protein